MTTLDPMPATPWITWDGHKMWPFFETAEGNIIGAGHQDPASFVAAVNAWEAAQGADPGNDPWEPGNVRHRMARITTYGPGDGDDESILAISDNGDLPVTTLVDA